MRAIVARLTLVFALAAGLAILLPVAAMGQQVPPPDQELLPAEVSETPITF